MTLAWLGAALERQKKMPDLKKLVGGEKQQAKSPEALAALIMQLGKAAKAKANG